MIAASTQVRNAIASPPYRTAGVMPDSRLMILSAPPDELIALIRYMDGHNVSHTNELKKLAHKLANTGDSEACAQILGAVRGR